MALAVLLWVASAAAAAVHPHVPCAHAESAEFQAERDRLVRAGDSTSALALVTRAMAQDAPGCAQHRNDIGVLRMNLATAGDDDAALGEGAGNVTLALAAFGTAVQLEPRQPLFSNNLVAFAHNLGFGAAAGPGAAAGALQQQPRRSSPSTS